MFILFFGITVTRLAVSDQTYSNCQQMHFSSPMTDVLIVKQQIVLTVKNRSTLNITCLCCPLSHICQLGLADKIFKRDDNTKWQCKGITKIIRSTNIDVISTYQIRDATDCKNHNTLLCVV